MDFIDELRQFSDRVKKIKDAITTEESTKTALILPFFQLLGYDVFNPMEFVPEFTADVGTKKGEKVDYAVIMDDNPVILIEAKWCGEPLERHDSQLFRYFGTSSAKFGILTNGITYKFYTDLNEPNKMDLDPFMEFNILSVQENLVTELKRFSKNTLDVDAAFNAASELKYSNLIKQYIHEQRNNPSDIFTKHIMGVIYDGTRTQQAIDRFRPIIKRGLNQYVNDAINETLKTALKNHSNQDPQLDETVATEADELEETISKINTTQEELEAFGVIKGLLSQDCDPSLLSYKDTESYFGILYDNKTTKWVCRLKLDGRKQLLIIPAAADPSGKENRISIQSVDDLYKHKDVLLSSVKRFL